MSKTEEEPTTSQSTAESHQITGDSTGESAAADLTHKITKFTCSTLKWGRDHVPPGVRSIIGLLFMIGGVFGFLPILGFWMLPLGAAFIALDFPPTRRRIENWIARLEEKVEKHDSRQQSARSLDSNSPEP